MLHLALALLAVAGSKTATVAEIDPFGPKGLRFATDDGAYSVKLGLLVQPQWTYTAAPGDDTNTFRVRRFELGFGGTFVSPRVKYKLKTAFDLPNRQGGVSARLLDASLEWMPIDELGFELGQYKVPFSYENLTTTGTNLLIDRSLADGDFGLDRDIGVTVKGRLFSGY